MSYTVVLSLDLDSPLTDFNLKWEEYSYRLKTVFNDKLIKISNHVPLGKNGHVELPLQFDNEKIAMQAMHLCDFYIDVYWKEKRIATEIRLREPQEYRWFHTGMPDYDLKDGHRDANFKADNAKFDKQTKINTAVRLATTSGNNNQNPSHTITQNIDQGKLDSSLIDRAKAAKFFKEIPSNYWILGERATINRPNLFDDVLHLMHGEKVIESVSGTTHPGLPGLHMTKRSHTPNTGVAVLDWGWHYDIWKKGRHHPTRQNIKAFTQKGSVRIFRDNNKDDIPANSGTPHLESGNGINFHPASYTGDSAKRIDTWSVGCVVAQSAVDYYSIYNKIVDSGQSILSLCVIDGNINGAK